MKFGVRNAAPRCDRPNLKPIYTAANATAAAEVLDAFDAEWAKRYPAAIRLRRNAWSELIPFLDYDTEIRTVICSVHAIGPCAGKPALNAFAITFADRMPAAETN